MVALVENSVERYGGLACLAIAENQLALAAPNGYERINDFNASLKRHNYGRAVHDGHRGAFNRQTLAGSHRSIAVERPAKRVDHAAQQAIAHSHVHDPAGALNFISCIEMPVLAEQNDADFVRVYVECDAGHIAGKHHQFIITYAGQTRHFSNAGGDTDDCARFS